MSVKIYLSTLMSICLFFYSIRLSSIYVPVYLATLYITMYLSYLSILSASTYLLPINSLFIYIVYIHLIYLSIYIHCTLALLQVIDNVLLSPQSCVPHGSAPSLSPQGLTNCSYMTYCWCRLQVRCAVTCSGQGDPFPIQL